MLGKKNQKVTSCPVQRSYQRSLNEDLCVLQTYFRISLQPIFNLYLFFLGFFKTLQYLKQMGFFAHKKLKKHPKKLHTYGSWEVFFFSAAPSAQNSPELRFHFIIFSIQSSLLGSLGKELRV